MAAVYFTSTAGGTITGCVDVNGNPVNPSQCCTAYYETTTNGTIISYCKHVSGNFSRPGGLKPQGFDKVMASRQKRFGSVGRLQPVKRPVFAQKNNFLPSHNMTGCGCGCSGNCRH